MISMEDYRKDDGNIDWDAHSKAEVDAGERCTECGAFRYAENMTANLFGIGLGKARADVRGPCHACRSMSKNTGESDHGSRLRCPKCRHSFETDWEMGLIDAGLKEEPCDVYCPSCDHEFEVGVSISYTYTSPPLLEEGEGDDES